MAAKAYNTARFVRSILPAQQSPIQALFALRGGVKALVDHLGQADLNTENDKSFDQAFDHLWELDQEVLAHRPTSIGDLRCQAAVIRHLHSNDVLCDDVLTDFLSHLETFDEGESDGQDLQH